VPKPKLFHIETQLNAFANFQVEKDFEMFLFATEMKFYGSVQIFSAKPISD